MDGRIATWIVTLTVPEWSLRLVKICEPWFSNAWELVANVHGQLDAHMANMCMFAMFPPECLYQSSSANFQELHNKNFQLWELAQGTLLLRQVHAPVLLLVLDRASPELDRIGAGRSNFWTGTGPLLHFCVAHALKPTMLKRLSHKAINLQQLRDTWHLTVWAWTLHLPLP